MRAELRDSLENLYPDSVVGKSVRRQITLDEARGATASVHVLINGLTRGNEVRFDVRCDGKRVRNAQWFRLVDVPVEENTGLCGFTESSLKRSDPPNAPNPHVVRRAPFRAYDAMEPVADLCPAETDTMALRCHVPIPRRGNPGTRTCDIRVTVDNTTTDLRFVVRVHDAVIPAVGPGSFPYTNWFSFPNIGRRHNLKLWTPAYWRMLKAYAELMAHGRQNAFLIPLSTVFEMRRGKPVLFKDRLQRIVRIFTDAGLHYIEGGHVAGRTGGEWSATTFDVALAKRRVSETDGHAVLASICQQLMNEIHRHNWESRWIQHATDEPTDTNADDYRILVGMVHKYMPGIPVLDATMDPALVGSVNIWCPQVQEYQQHRQAFEDQRALGDKIWFYTCCFPGGPWLNRLLDQELLRPTLFGWAAALFQLDGFLHWGLNHYRRDQDPFRKNVIGNWGGNVNSLPAGDTHVVYPGRNGPWSSLRFEAQREGCEDYELLTQLRRDKPHAANRVVRKAVKGFDQYVTNVKTFRAARRNLLKELDQ